MTDLQNRRPLKSRDTEWARRAAVAMAKAGVQANLISATSVAFAVLGAALLALAGTLPGWARPLALLVAAACIQGRLACNLLDGMVAVEHGQGSASGPIWNELPDRISDLLFFVGAGYAAASLGWAFGGALGWFTGAMAILTAYVRELGRGLGLPADFTGPMAKPQRMAALTIVCVVAAVEPLWHGNGLAMIAGLIVIGSGAAWTVIRRVSRMATALAARP